MNNIGTAETSNVVTVTVFVCLGRLCVFVWDGMAVCLFQHALEFLEGFTPGIRFTGMLGHHSDFSNIPAC